MYHRRNEWSHVLIVRLLYSSTKEIPVYPFQVYDREEARDHISFQFDTILDFLVQEESPAQ